MQLNFIFWMVNSEREFSLVNDLGSEKLPQKKKLKEFPLQLLIDYLDRNYLFRDGE